MNDELKIPTFSEQSEIWLSNIVTRRRNPVKKSSVVAFRSHLNWWNPRIGNKLLSEINNRTLKELVPQINGQSKTVLCYVSTVKAVVGSALDDNGDPRFPREWNSDFIDLPTVGQQKQPMYTSEQIKDIISRGNGESFLYKSAAVTGARIGELLALEPRHVNGRTLTIEQTMSQKGEVWSPKTENGFRQIDLPVAFAEEFQEHVQKRTTGYVFEVPGRYSGALQKLHDILEDLKIPQTGFHAFRRFRETHLDKMNVHEKLQNFWMGWSAEKGKMRLKYSKLERNVDFRLTEAERVGMGFEK